MNGRYNVFPYIKKEENGQLVSEFHVLMYDDVMQDIIKNQESLWNYEPWKVNGTNNYINKEKLVENYLQQITSKILACDHGDQESFYEYLTGGDLDNTPPFRCFNLGLKKQGRYMLLYMISKEQLSKEQNGSKYWNWVGRHLPNNKDKIVTFMSENSYDYFAFKVDDASFIKDCPYQGLKETEPIDFYKNDLCRMHINLKKITKTVEDSANFKHIANDYDNKKRLPKDIKSITDDDNRLLIVKEIVRDALDRLKRNPRLAIPCGINNGNKENNVRSQFLIPVYENKLKSRPFGALVARCKVITDEANSKAKSLEPNLAEFSSCFYEFPTLLTLEMAVEDSLAYVNFDKNVWCNIQKE